MNTPTQVQSPKVVASKLQYLPLDRQQQLFIPRVMEHKLSHDVFRFLFSLLPQIHQIVIIQLSHYYLCNTRFQSPHRHLVKRNFVQNYA